MIKELAIYKVCEHKGEPALMWSRLLDSASVMLNYFGDKNVTRENLRYYLDKLLKKRLIVKTSKGMYKVGRKEIEVSDDLKEWEVRFDKYLSSKATNQLEQLKHDIKELRAAMRNLTADYWDKVWNVISTERYKTARQILTDAGIIDSSMDYIQIQAEINYLKEVLRDLKYECELEKREYPLEYDPDKGWKKKL